MEALGILIGLAGCIFVAWGVAGMILAIIDKLNDNEES